MTAIALAGAQVSPVTPAVEPVPLERVVVLSSPPHVVPKVTAICAHGAAITVASVVADRSTIVHHTATIAPQVAPIVADVARIRPDVAAIRADVARVAPDVTSGWRNGRLRGDGNSGGCDTKCHCGAQGRES